MIFIPCSQGEHLSFFPISRIIIWDLFKKSPWFETWPSFEASEVFKWGTIKKYSKGDSVYKDYASDDLCFLAQGSLWACLAGENGLIKFSIISPPGLLGMAQMLGEHLEDKPCYEFYAAEDSTVLILPSSAIEEQLDKKPLLWRPITEAAIFFQRQCVRQVVLLCCGTIKERLISAIYHYGLSGTSRPYRQYRSLDSISQEEWALMIQSSRQHVNRALRELEQEGILTLGYKRIEIKNPLELERLALARYRRMP